MIFELRIGRKKSEGNEFMYRQPMVVSMPDSSEMIEPEQLDIVAEAFAKNVRKMVYDIV